MGKRRREEAANQKQDDELEVIYKKSRQDQSNGYQSEVQEAGIGSHVDVWLVRKPKTLDMSELSNFTFPKKIKPSNSMKKLNTEMGLMDCTFEKPAKSFFYFQSPLERSDKNPIVGIGLARIKLPSEVEDPFPEAVEDDLELMDVKVEKEEVPRLPFKLKSIRKEPCCSLNTKERLKAFGVIEPVEIGSRKKVKKEHRAYH